MANDAPDYVQPVKIETGEVVINPGSSPIPITPTAASTFRITGPVTIAGTTVNVPVDTSYTPSFGSTCLYAEWYIPLSSGGTTLYYMDVSKFASVFVAGWCQTANWALYVPSVTPDPSNIDVWEQMFTVYRNTFFAWWFPIVGPQIRPRFCGPTGNTLNYLVIYGSTLPAPTYGGGRTRNIVLQGSQTIAAGSTAYWYTAFSLGAHMLCVYLSNSLSTTILVEGFDWQDTRTCVYYYYSGTTRGVTAEIGLGPYYTRIAVTNNGSSSNTALVTLTPL
jgi:hypothetical protein